MLVQGVPATRQEIKWRRNVGAERVIRAADEELHGFAALRPNWDSYDGDPPSDHAITRASALLATTQYLLGTQVGERIGPDYVAPRSDGGVQIEWSSALRKISVEITAEGRLAYLLVDNTSGRREAKEQHDVSASTIYQQIAVVVFDVDDESSV
jgi:hypothetical protein